MTRDCLDCCFVTCLVLTRSGLLHYTFDALCHEASRHGITGAIGVDRAKVVAALVKHYTAFHSTANSAAYGSTHSPQDEGERGGCQDASAEFYTENNKNAEELDSILVVPLRGRHLALPTFG